MLPNRRRLGASIPRYRAFGWAAAVIGSLNGTLEFCKSLPERFPRSVVIHRYDCILSEPRKVILQATSLAPHWSVS